MRKTDAEPAAFDDESPWGTYRPSAGTAALLKAAHAVPRPLRSINKLLRKPVKYGSGTALDIEVFNLKLRLRVRGNATDQSVYTAPRLFDRAEFSLLAKHLRPGGVFVDIGANSGMYSLRAHGLMEGQGRIVAVEPDPEMRRQLEFNIRTNRLRNIDVCPVALSDHDGTAQLQINPQQRGTNTLDLDEARRAGGVRTALEVPLTTLLALLGELGIVKIDALKIDIEGHEPPVLRHFFTHAPESMWPKAMISEFKHQTAAEILELLARCGYRRLASTKLNYIFERG